MAGGGGGTHERRRTQLAPGGHLGPQAPPDSQHHSSREPQAASEQTRLGEGCAPNHGRPNRGAHPCCSHQAERNAHIAGGHHLSEFWLGVRAALVALQETGKLGCATQPNRRDKSRRAQSGSSCVQPGVHRGGGVKRLHQVNKAFIEGGMLLS